MMEKELRTLDEMLTNLEIWSTWNKTFANEMIGICSKMRNLLADRKTENSSERIKTYDYCDICNHKRCGNCVADSRDDYCVPSGYEPKDEPQTETEIAKAIVHKMIDDAVIAEDAYPDLRQKMHDAVDEYELQTDRSMAVGKRSDATADKYNLYGKTTTDEPQTMYYPQVDGITPSVIIKTEPQTDCPKSCPTIDICTKDDTDCPWK